mgnify:CR=1 FL=1
MITDEGSDENDTRPCLALTTINNTPHTTRNNLTIVFFVMSVTEEPSSHLKSFLPFHETTRKHHSQSYTQGIVHHIRKDLNESVEVFLVQ